MTSWKYLSWLVPAALLTATVSIMCPQVRAQERPGAA